MKKKMLAVVLGMAMTVSLMAGCGSKGDAATEEVLNAWAEAYEVIAKIFVEVEKDIYIDQICRDNQIHQTL